ncbi:hypothetical protein NEIRO03_0414 [Nematocida sp. AWRm78]|nr:hypothetical protein NEIRO02_0342 [Nematocida sp. AWRm79]KAI5182763.1 hypothetical protein NEIRO03_0414 [Nematocida sp. AWRm78]
MRVYYISILLFISSIITTDNNEFNEYKHIERVKQLETLIKTMRDNISTIKPSMTHKKKTNILINIQQKIKSGITGTSSTSSASGITGTSSTSSTSAGTSNTPSGITAGTSSTSNISAGTSSISDTPSRILRTGSVSGTNSMGSTPDMSNILRIPCTPDMSNMVYKPYPRTPSIPNIPSMEIPYKECITNTPDIPVYKEYEYNGCTPYKHIIPNSTLSIGSAPDKPRRHNSIPNISNTLSIPHTPAISSMSNAVSTPNMSNTPSVSDGISNPPPVPKRNIHNTPPVPAPRRDINKSGMSNTPNTSDGVSDHNTPPVPRRNIHNTPPVPVPRRDINKSNTPNTSNAPNTPGVSNGILSVPVPRHSLNKPINPLLDPVTCTQNVPPTKNIEYLMVDTCFECINVLEIYLLYLNIQVKDLPSIRKDLLRIIESARE